MNLPFRITEFLSTDEARCRGVDVGAVPIPGVAEPYSPMRQLGLLDMVFFDPVPGDAVYDLHPGDHVLPIAVGNGDTHTLHITNTGMTSSLFEPNLRLMDRYQNLGELCQVVRTEQVETVRLDAVQEVRPCHYLKLDVQGAEVMVLEGAEATLRDVMVIHTEVEWVELYKGQPLYEDVAMHLRGQGFQLLAIQGFAGRAMKPLVVNGDLNLPLTQHLWSDAVFIRDLGHLDEMGTDHILKCAALLHELYGAPDVVHYLLSAADSRRGTSLAERYLSYLTGQA